MTVQFHKGSIKLAGLYLAIMMAISIFFSANVYQLSVQEFERGFRGPVGGVSVAFGRVGPSFTTQARDILQEELEQQYQEAKARVVRRLILTNIFILVGGGVLSYFLALRTLKPIEEAQEAQNRFTADASHELRTPITAMRTENEVTLMDPKLTLAKAKKQISSNIEELEKLTQLSEGLLRLASLENNDLKKEEIKAIAVVNKALNRVLPLAEKKNILINTKIDKNGVVIGDESSLVEALVILLDNAVKYSPPKTEVKVTLEKKPRHIAINVVDQGIGIKASELPHIFERFYRADSSRSKQSINGYGLGLAIAKNIADLHGGLLTATSKPGHGSTFSLILPD